MLKLVEENIFIRGLIFMKSRFLAVALTGLLLMPVLPGTTASAAAVRCDTTTPVSLHPGSSYTFKITSEGTPGFTVGNGGAFQTKMLSKKGNSYYFQVTANGNPGDSAGVYTSLPGQAPVRQCVVSIVKNPDAAGDWLLYNSDDHLFAVRTDGTGGRKLGNASTKLFAFDGNWIYYGNNDDHGRLYKITIAGTGKTKLSDEIPEELQIQNGWLYYRGSDRYDGTGKMSIYKMRTDGTGKATLFTSDVPFWFELRGDWFYGYRDILEDGAFTALGEKELYKMKIDGTGFTVLKKGNSMYDFTGPFHFDGDWLYYGPLSRIKTDGTCDEKLANLYVDPVYQYDGDWIYYIGYDGKYHLYKMNLRDGSGPVSLCDSPGQVLSVADGWVYYGVAEDESMGIYLYRIRDDGTGNMRIGSSSCRSITIAGDWIYYINVSDGEKPYKIRTDGSGQTKLSNNVVSSLLQRFSAA